MDSAVLECLSFADLGIVLVYHLGIDASTQLTIIGFIFLVWLSRHQLAIEYLTIGFEPVYGLLQPLNLMGVILSRTLALELASLQYLVQHVLQLREGDPLVRGSFQHLLQHTPHILTVYSLDLPVNLAIVDN